MSDTTNTVQDTAQTLVVDMDDTQDLIDQCTELFTDMLPIVKDHFHKTRLKSACSVSVDFIPSKDDDQEFIVRITPKTSLPRETEEHLGEISDNGNLRLL